MTEHRRLVALVSTRGRTPEEVAAELIMGLDEGGHLKEEQVDEQRPPEQPGRPPG